MRIALSLTVHMAIALAVAVAAVPASLAQDSRVPDPGKPAGAGTETGDWQTQQKLGRNSGVSVAEPIGRVWIGPDAVEGEATYVRRMTVTAGMTIVEVSTTPFMPILASGEEPLSVMGRPDQPASW